MRTWAFPIVLLCLLASCASNQEAALVRMEVEEEELAGFPAEGEDHPAVGLEIKSSPGEAAVYLNNRYRGLTPLLLPGLDQGRYRLRLERKGYRPVSAWIRYNASYLRYEFVLEEMSGYLLVDVSPPQADILVGERSITSGQALNLPAGMYEVQLRAFGYEDRSSRVTISDRQTTELEISLAPAAFRISPLSLNRESFNPSAPGLLGRITVHFQVDAPGAGSVSFFDESMRRVDSLSLDDFTSRNQAFDWPGKDAAGAPLPDGGYLIRVQARGQNGETETREASVVIDSSRITSRRSLYSGASGLLFAPTPELLPPRTTQVSTLALARIGSAGLRAPWIAGFRVGLNKDFELDLHGGFIVGREPSLEEDGTFQPFLAGAALKAGLFSAGSHPRLEGALLLKLAYQHARTDTLSSFTGASAGVPCSVRLGNILLVASPQLILSPWSVSYDQTLDFDDLDWSDWSLWLYGRAGLLWEAGGWQLGLSTALRFSPLSGGVGAGLKPDMPCQTGLELHRLVPGTQLYLTLAVAAELGSNEEIYAGIGLGLID